MQAAREGMPVMAAQDDSVFFEGSVDANSEQGDKWLSPTVRDYVGKTASLLRVLEAGGYSVKDIDEHHKRLLRAIATQVTNESSNLIEQAALTCMVGTSLLATFNAQVDYMDFQLDLLEAEGGDGRG